MRPRALPWSFGPSTLLLWDLLLGSGTAAASPYALTRLEITNLTLSAGGAGISVGSIGTFPGSLQEGPSGTLARLGADQEVSVADPVDAAAACLGPSCASIGENDFGQQSAGEFTRADSLILSTDLLAGDAGARLVAEHRDLDAPAAFPAPGFDDRGIIDIFTTITLDAAASLTISFSADVFLATSAAEPASVGAETAVLFEIRNAPEYFSWEPGNIGYGGTVTDAFDLNAFNDIFSPPGDETYDPTGDGIGGSTGLFTAVTFPLEAGVPYDLRIIAMARVDGRTTAVGEPSATALLAMGVGLVHLSRAARPRRARDSGRLPFSPTR